ncbi:hypothetical protein PMW_137 [Pseudomonas phage phiPMW]|uniref:Uncharacterized protein n=1 Tax=Pseudomonas phage phiPMW TaxID=1815582 RepID=A0A1S5R1G7_9CAUD|nr:tail length tape measure protein [Pseudomonas phage phiPMW]ANA49262.1 hypothetical protein PMW_137 [Pseudomonas phage phiPMW]
MFGLTLEELPQEDYLIWDCNWPAFDVFSNMATQWRVGFNGAIGLDYNAIPFTAKCLGYKNKQVKAMFPDLQVMENEALITMGENQKNADNR